MNHSKTSTTMGSAQEYSTTVREILDTALRLEAPLLAEAGALVAERFSRDGLLHIFGSGHSHIFAEEAFYRAGGSARISPILRPRHMLHDGAQRSTVLERESGHAAEILEDYSLDASRDAMLVVSNSGANALPVEMAQEAKERGLAVLAITSKAYARTSSATGPRLHDIADIAIDNHCPPGDAIVSLSPNGPRVGPASSVVGLALLNTLLVDAMARQKNTGGSEVFVSAGMPDVAAHNAALADRFRGRVHHI